MMPKQFSRPTTIDTSCGTNHKTQTPPTPRVRGATSPHAPSSRLPFPGAPQLRRTGWSTSTRWIHHVMRARSTATLEVGRGWRESEGEWRWATSPATLIVTSSRPGYAELDFTPALIHDSTSPNGLGDRGLMTVQTAGYTNTVEISSDQTTTVPLILEGGSQIITLALKAGNFRPSDYSGSTDPSLLSFAIRSVNLRLIDDT